MQRGTDAVITNLTSPCTRSDGLTNGQNETSFAASKFSVLVLMEKYDKLFLDTEKMSYFPVSVSVFPYFSNDNMCQLSANCFCFAQNFCIDLAFFVLFRQTYTENFRAGHCLAQVYIHETVGLSRGSSRAQGDSS